MRAHVIHLLAVHLLGALAFVSACRSAAPPIRFAPPGTDVARLRSEYPLSDAERMALTPETVRRLTQDQIDQIYARLTSGPIPDGPYRGDLFFPRDRSRDARIRDLPDPAPSLLSRVAALPVERLGRAFWKGKVFFRSQGILRNRIEDVAVLKLIVEDVDTIPRLTFDGESTWLLFPARVSCGESRFDSTRPSIVIDYSRGPEIEGYRRVPDALAGAERLNIRDEVRVVRRGFYLGRAYFGERFALNFTLIDPASTAGAPSATAVPEDCDAARTSGR